jgi:molecular chaperone GrpE
MSQPPEIKLEQPEFNVVSATLLSSLQVKAAEANEKTLRTMAEWENARKRLAQDKQESVKFANEGLLESLLPVVDNFELGMQAAATAKDAKSIAVGLQMVLTQMRNFLQEQGLEPIEAIGKPFDPHRHEALGEVEAPDQPEGTVVSQVRRGYLYKGKLMRPATVYLAKVPATPA